MGSPYEGVMKRTVLALTIATALLPTYAAEAATDDIRTLTGQYKWNYQKSPGKLRAVFTPVDRGNWEVVFHFTFDGRKHAYAGTAEGTLSEGELKGTVKNENRRRTFVFEGRFEEGTFRGRHAEIRGTGQRKTGTLILAE